MVDQPPIETDIDVEEAPRLSEEHERARALAAVLREQSERADLAVEVEARRARRTRIRRIGLAVVWAGIAWVWISGPPPLSPPAPPAPTVEQETRALRVHVFLQAQRIEAYRQGRGRLPYVLQEAGPVFPGITYRRRDNRSYELEARADRVRVFYASERGAVDFVGDAAAALGPGGGTP